MSTYTPGFLPVYRPLNDSGVPVPGCVLLFYLAGSSTPTPVYNSAGVSLGTSLTADAYGGFVPFFFDPAITYKIDLQTPAGASFKNYPVDNVQPIPASAPAANAGLDMLQIKALLG